MTSTTPVRKGQRYRRLTIGLIGIGIVSLLAGLVIDRSLAGLVVYALAVVGAFAVIVGGRYSDEVIYQDERQLDLGRRASHLTFQLFGYLGLFGFVALMLLDAAGRMPLSSTAETLLYAYAVVTLTWGGIYNVLKYGR